MKTRTVYQIEINGKVSPEEYDSNDSAIDAIESMMANDKTIDVAEIVKVQYTYISAVRNK